MTATKFAMKAKPTNADLQAQAFELHECLHQTAAKVDGAVEKVDDLGVVITALAQALHVEIPNAAARAQGATPRIRGRLGSMKPWHAIAVLAPTIVAAPGVYKLLEPPAIAFFVSLHRALLAH